MCGLVPCLLLHGRKGGTGRDGEGGRDRRREGGREGEVEQDLLSTLKCELVPCLLLLGRVRETGREQDLLPTLPFGLVNCILLRGREGGRVAGRETGEGGRQRVFCQPPSVCLLLKNCSMNVTNHRKRKQ